MVRLLAALFLVLSFSAAAQYPAKPVRLVVPFPAGSTPDIVGRTLGQRLAEAWHQPVIVDNKTGAGGNIGTAEVAHAAPDGYTLLIGINGPIAVNKALYKSLPYDPEKDLEPLSLLASGAQILAVHPGVPGSTLPDFVNFAKNNPDKLSYGSVGAGSASHLTMELLKSQAGISLVHVPYRGFPPVVQDLLAGNIQATFAIVPAVLPQIKAGKLKGLAVTSAARSALAPGIATVAEQGFPQFDATAWIGLLGPAGLPREVSERIASETQRAMKLPEVRDLLGKQGFDVVGGTPPQFAEFIRAETAKWTAIVKATGARAE
ncbi:MAG TPA: tripartite tricarboxylate transporter substrate binding protein [Burkholderiales bacterium]|jgi:tripartite-type tricarboxylate transporter receptor subunit TctC|nr:tripartite tricarboxylate transporter substrate binding protein [Burkholderiales bacterium]